MTSCRAALSRRSRRRAAASGCSCGHDFTLWSAPPQCEQWRASVRTCPRRPPAHLHSPDFLRAMGARHQLHGQCGEGHDNKEEVGQLQVAEEKN